MACQTKPMVWSAASLDSLSKKLAPPPANRISSKIGLFLRLKGHSESHIYSDCLKESSHSTSTLPAATQLAPSSLPSKSISLDRGDKKSHLYRKRETMKPAYRKPLNKHINAFGAILQSHFLSQQMIPLHGTTHCTQQPSYLHAGHILTAGER